MTNKPEQLEILKPCPFCGGKAYICQSYGDWYVGCNCPVEPGSQAYEKDKAVELWNNRPLEVKAKQEQKEKDAEIAEKTALYFAGDNEIDKCKARGATKVAKAIRES